MKKTILLSSIFAVGAAFASATVDSTEIGVMGIDMPTKAALIAVPFLGYDTTNIKVADMVNTAELAPNSELYVPNDSGKYDVWTLSSSRKWEETKENVVIGADGTVGSGDTPNAADVLTPRGGAFWLKPAGTPTGNCYLLGKPASDAGTSAAVGGKWNLIGNASDVAVNLTSLGGVDGDQIVVQNGAALKYYTYKEGGRGWTYTQAGKIKTAETLSIGVGQGLWYKPATSTTIDWSTGRAKVADNN